MADDLPPVADCDTESDTDCCVTSKTCYDVKEAVPVCSSTSSAQSHTDTNCTKLDKTFDKILQALIIPTVGSEAQINLCDSSLYTVGSWIEFVDGPYAGTKLQVTTVNAVSGYIKARNSCSDGVSAIDDNASPGATLAEGTRFVVVGSPDCLSQDSKVSNLETLLSEVEDVCLEEVPDKAATEELEFLGVTVVNECAEGEVQPCLRRAETREAKDGSLILGNIDENQETVDTTIFPPFINSKNKIVKGVTPSSTGTSVGQYCEGEYRQVQGGRIWVPVFENIVEWTSVPGAASKSETKSISSILSDNNISVCHSGNGPAYICLTGYMHGVGGTGDLNKYQCLINGSEVIMHMIEDDDSNIASNGFIIVKIPVSNDIGVTFKPLIGSSDFGSIDYLRIDSTGIFV